jgi:hypothetical protein
MKEIINTIIKQSKFTVSCFDGQLLLEGRILSPSEAQAAGLATGLLASSLGTPEELQKMSAINDNETDDNFERLLNIAKSIKPDTLLAIGETQDKMICKVINRASSDGGSSWQRIHLVEGIDQQNPDTNRLWVGMLPDEDRKEIISLAMEGHQKALQKIRGSV